MLRWLADVTVKLLSITFALKKVPEEREKKRPSIFKKGKREHRGKYKSASVISQPGKLMERILLETISEQEDMKMIKEVRLDL